MAKYIDVEKLKRLVGELKKHAERNRCDVWGIVPDALEEVDGFITSLQQEHPKVDSEMLNYKKMLELLLESISYAYAKTDGTYGSLSPVVSDKVRYIEKQLRELALKRKLGNSYEIH